MGHYEWLRFKAMAGSGHTKPGIAGFEALAAEAMQSIPEELRARVENVVVRVEEFPDQETQHEMELDSPNDLLGLYRGVSLDLKSVADVTAEVDMIFLYRNPILEYRAETGEDLFHLVRHVLIHEIGHHFGFSDDDMERIEEET